MESEWLHRLFPASEHTAWRTAVRVEPAGAARTAGERELDALWLACLPSSAGAAASRPVAAAAGSGASQQAFLRYAEAYTAAAAAEDAVAAARLEPPLMPLELVRSFKAAVHEAHAALPLRSFTGASTDFTTPPPPLPAVGVLLTTLEAVSRGRPVRKPANTTEPAATSPALT